ncbi:MAG: carboxypeptidase M32 [Candidatus Hodarchaeota archaeon]
MTKEIAAYDELMGKFKEIVLLETVGAIMGWDTEVYIPPNGFPLRGEQMALLGQLRHRMYSSPEIGKLLDKAESKTIYGSLNEVQQRNIDLIRREYDAMVKMPEELVAAYAKQQTKTVQIWKRAKAKKDWKMFEPELQALFDLVVKRADILMKVRDTPTPYDALIDIFEPRMNQTTINQVFTDLRNDLIPLVDKYSEVSKKVDTSFLKRKIPIEAQRKIATALCDFILYDTTSDKAGGRIDETEHPFSTGYFQDVRITTHYYEENFASSMYSVLHEGGHALYGQNHDPTSIFQPWGDASSYGIHESQSRFVENMLGRSKEFTMYFLPKLNKLTNNTFKDIGVDQFTKAVNQVKRSKIRIEADEVTYSLHVIIRFEIEQALFANKVQISELPSVWNEKYDKYLGVKIKHDSEGVMQDTHWASGYHGYFPSYALGNIYGGQLLAKMEQELPDWLDQVAVGKFASIKQWMVDNVHKHGNLYNPEDLIKLITGEGLNAKPFINYLTVKYKRIFNT